MNLTNNWVIKLPKWEESLWIEKCTFSIIIKTCNVCKCVTIQSHCIRAVVQLRHQMAMLLLLRVGAFESSWQQVAYFLQTTMPGYFLTCKLPYRLLPLPQILTRMGPWFAMKFGTSNWSILCISLCCRNSTWTLTSDSYSLLLLLLLRCPSPALSSVRGIGAHHSPKQSKPWQPEIWDLRGSRIEFNYNCMVSHCNVPCDSHSAEVMNKFTHAESCVTSRAFEAKPHRHHSTKYKKQRKCSADVGSYSVLNLLAYYIIYNTVRCSRCWLMLHSCYDISRFYDWCRMVDFIALQLLLSNSCQVPACHRHSCSCWSVFRYSFLKCTPVSGSAEWQERNGESMCSFKGHSLWCRWCLDVHAL